jgi:hypothetical protein
MCAAVILLLCGFYSCVYRVLSMKRRSFLGLLAGAGVGWDYLDNNSIDGSILRPVSGFLDGESEPNSNPSAFSGGYASNSNQQNERTTTDVRTTTADTTSTTSTTSTGTTTSTTDSTTTEVTETTAGDRIQ